MILLDVPYHRQQLETSCFPAAVKMVLEFFGSDVDEHLLWRKGQILGHKGTWDAKLAPYVIQKGFHFESYWSGSVERSKLPPGVKKAYLKATKGARKAGWRYAGKGTTTLIKRYLLKGIPGNCTKYGSMRF